MKYFKILILVVFLSSCSSLTPKQVHESLPTYTKSKYFTPTQASMKLKNNTCKMLVKDRSYAAPIGFAPKNDLKNAARGIDEWVELDGGNAYVLKNFKWVTVDDDVTQLYVDFDTMICD